METALLPIQGKLKIRQDARSGLMLPCIDEQGTLLFENVIALTADRFADTSSPLRAPYFQLWSNDGALRILRRMMPSEHLEAATRKLSQLQHMTAPKRFEATLPEVFLTFYIEDGPRWKHELEFLEEHRTHWRYNEKRRPLFKVKQTGYGASKAAQPQLCWVSKSVVITSSGDVIWGV